MKGQWKKGWQVLTVLLATSLVGAAQTNAPAGRGMASPGTVNYVEGQVTLAGQPLSGGTGPATVIAPNQTITTGNGYVELLLTPGAFLRIGHNSELSLLSAGLTDVQLRLDRGSAMIEAADVVKGSNLSLAMQGATTRVEDRGLYAFDAGSGAIRVLDGKAQVVDPAGHDASLKKGKELLLADNPQLKKTGFNVQAAESEPLYVWSKVRSEAESQANYNVASAVAAGGAWYGPGWYWDPLWANYAFVPGSGFLGGPFGWGFYSPGFAYAVPWGFYGPRYYGGARYFGRAYYGHPVRGSVGGIRTGVRANPAVGFHGGFSGGFHGAAGGGFHGGGHR